MSGHHSHVTCTELTERVTELLDGAIGEAERVRLEQHLVWCEMCVDHVEQMRRAGDVLARLATDDDALDHDDAAAIAAELLRRVAARGDGT